eukprot:833934_1
MSSKLKRRLVRSFSFRKKQKIKQSLDDAFRKTVNAADALLNKEDLSTAEGIIRTLIKRYPQQKQNGNGATAPTDEPNHGAAAKQLHLFLKSCRLEQYFGALRETGCADIRDIEYANEDIFEDIVFKSKMHKRRLIGECKKLRKQMDEFRKETKANGIPSIVVDELSDFGIVTMDILCKEVEQKSDLKDKFDIGNVQHCEMLWTLIDTYLHPEMQTSVTHGQREEIAEME